MTTKVETRKIKVLNGKLEMFVQVAGRGEPLVFLHAAAGLMWDEFLDELATRYTVYAPVFPGCYPDVPEAIDNIDDIWDAVLAYDDLLDGLGLESAFLMGHSFGGMLAAELAAQRRNRVRKLVLISPIGLWKESHPYTVMTWCGVSPQELPAVLFHRLDPAPVQRMLTPPADQAQADEATLNFVWALGCTGKIVWPIPDKGLKKRIHRISAPTLIAWGEHDRLISSAYAGDFGKAIGGSEVFMIPDCGHEPPLEQLEMLSAKVHSFLAA